MPSSAVRVYPPIYRLGTAGKWIRDALMASILHGTPVILKIQQYRRPFLTSFMKGVAFLGEEEFYSALLPFIIWICDFRLGTLLAMLMALAFYLAGVLKNILCLPRPPRPPVTPIDKCKDWSLPSHHSILNVNVPWYIWLYIYIRFDWPSLWLLVAFMGVSFWCFSILFSRLYLGVHSPADILVGGIVGCGLLVSWLRLDDWVYSIIGMQQFALSVVMIGLVLISIHPDPYPQTIILSESTTMLFVAVGTSVGAYLSHALNIDVRAIFEKEAEVVHIHWYLLRYVIGMAVVLIVQLTLSRLLYHVMFAVLNFLSITCYYAKRTSQVTSDVVHYHPDKFIVLDKPDQNTPSSYYIPVNVYWPQKAIISFALGFLLTSIIPFCFTQLGL
jgi:membrane-associated phospholipid phosphatase